MLLGPCNPLSPYNTLPVTHAPICFALLSIHGIVPIIFTSIFKFAHIPASRETFIR
jgi:hypothetical protein